MSEIPFSTLLGETLTAITGMKSGSDEIVFSTARGRCLRMRHQQACCESVSVEDVVGSPDDLIGSPLTMAEESSSKDRPSDLPKPRYEPESQTWTFYKLATVKGYVDIRWLGESNGFYSEMVSLYEDEDRG